jgi:glucokinase
VGADSCLRANSFVVASGVAAEIGHLGLVPGVSSVAAATGGALRPMAQGRRWCGPFAAHKDPVAAKRLIERASGDIAAIDGPMITEQAQLGDRVPRRSWLSWALGLAGLPISRLWLIRVWS